MAFCIFFFKAERKRINLPRWCMRQTSRGLFDLQSRGKRRTSCSCCDDPLSFQDVIIARKCWSPCDTLLLLLLLLLLPSLFPCTYRRLRRWCTLLSHYGHWVFLPFYSFPSVSSPNASTKKQLVLLEFFLSSRVRFQLAKNRSHPSICLDIEIVF